MTLTRPSEERILPVRLTQIREQARLAAARSIAKREPSDGAEVFFAAMFPSDTVYWIAPSALPILNRISTAGRLTRREREVLEGLAKGLTQGEIARELWLSPQTVKSYTATLYEKLGVHSREDAVAVAHERLAA